LTGLLICFAISASFLHETATAPLRPRHGV